MSRRAPKITKGQDRLTGHLIALGRELQFREGKISAWVGLNGPELLQVLRALRALDDEIDRVLAQRAGRRIA